MFRLAPFATSSIIEWIHVRIGGGVLSKCANPICVVPFRYLREGKIFNIELKKTDSFGQVKVEHFWLCETCSKTLKVVVENGIVVTRPLRLSLPSGNPRERTESTRNVA